jgi:hypothetical protein
VKLQLAPGAQMKVQPTCPFEQAALHPLSVSQVNRHGPCVHAGVHVDPALQSTVQGPFVQTGEHVAPGSHTKEQGPLSQLGAQVPEVQVHDPPDGPQGADASTI